MAYTCFRPAPTLNEFESVELSSDHIYSTVFVTLHRSQRSQFYNSGPSAANLGDRIASFLIFNSVKFNDV